MKDFSRKPLHNGIKCSINEHQAYRGITNAQNRFRKCEYKNEELPSIPSPSCSTTHAILPMIFD
jgi:hypothetical protein